MSGVREVGNTYYTIGCEIYIIIEKCVRLFVISGYQSLVTQTCSLSCSRSAGCIIICHSMSIYIFGCHVWCVTLYACLLNYLHKTWKLSVSRKHSNMGKLILLYTSSYVGETPLNTWMQLRCQTYSFPLWIPGTVLSYTWLTIAHNELYWNVIIWNRAWIANTVSTGI